MDRGLTYKDIPKVPTPAKKGFQGGVLVPFPTAKGASPNEVCDKCGAYDDCCCGKEKY